jgi:hypothetical protein
LFIALRINKEKQLDEFKKHLVTWTPTIAILDNEGIEHFRFTGFLSAVELCARIILDGAKTRLDLGNYELALKYLNQVIDTYKESFAMPEAIFYFAVATYLSTHKRVVLREGLERLRREFPKSEWALKAKPFELIKV